MTKLTKKSLKKLLGLSDENFSFYLKCGKIRKVGKSHFEYDEDMHDMILERSTVFKYTFEDGFVDELREFVKIVKTKSPCKVFTPEELEEYKKLGPEEFERQRQEKLDKQ